MGQFYIANSLPVYSRLWQSKRASRNLASGVCEWFSLRDYKMVHGSECVPGSLKTWAWSQNCIFLQAPPVLAPEVPSMAGLSIEQPHLGWISLDSLSTAWEQLPKRKMLFSMGTTCRVLTGLSVSDSDLQHWLLLTDVDRRSISLLELAWGMWASIGAF